MDAKQYIKESREIKGAVLNDDVLIRQIEGCADNCVQRLKNGGAVFFCGNGGSAADAQHLSAELSGRFRKNRAPLKSEAFHVNSSYVTAAANDFGYDMIYERLAEAWLNEKDMLILLSTSGNSKNIVRAAKKANEKGAMTIGFSGSSGGELAELCDSCIKVPSQTTSYIQEMHITIGHYFCLKVEKELFPG